MKEHKFYAISPQMQNKIDEIMGMIHNIFSNTGVEATDDMREKILHHHIPNMRWAFFDELCEHIGIIIAQSRIQRDEDFPKLRTIFKDSYDILGIRRNVRKGNDFEDIPLFIEVDIAEALNDELEHLDESIVRDMMPQLITFFRKIYL